MTLGINFRARWQPCGAQSGRTHVTTQERQNGFPRNLILILVGIDRAVMTGELPEEDVHAFRAEVTEWGIPDQISSITANTTARHWTLF